MKCMYIHRTLILIHVYVYSVYKECEEENMQVWKGYAGGWNMHSSEFLWPAWANPKSQYLYLSPYKGMWECDQCNSLPHFMCTCTDVVSVCTCT